jgi:very-short-patch-repair endonuclease
MEHRASRVDPQLLAFARSMRHEPAPAEQKLWQCLKNRRLGGFKFRRQVPIDQYVADFYCAECKLIVELDGDSHFQPGAYEKDARRTDKLIETGYSITRFTNIDLFESLEGVLDAPLEECEKRRHLTSRPSPCLSPEYRGEESGSR